MKRAVMRDAVRTQQFYFRKSFVPEDEEDVDSSHASKPKSHDHEYTLMDTNTIINGKVRPYIHNTRKHKKNDHQTSFCRMSFQEFCL